MRQSMHIQIYLFILDTDASNYAIGAELLQVQNGVERLTGFGSFVLDSALCIVIQVISSVLYRIANHKRYMVAHHDPSKICSDRELPIWSLRKRPELRGILGEDVGDRVLEQATDALRDREDYGRCVTEPCLLR